MGVGAVENVVYSFFRKVGHRCFQRMAIELANGVDLPENQRILIFPEGNDRTIVD